MDDVIRRLRDLEARATKGPWRAYVGCKVRTEPLSRQAWRGDQVEDRRDVSTIADCALSVRTTPETYEVAGANSDLIAAMRNALPALLDVAEAAGHVASNRAEYDGEWVKVTLTRDEWKAFHSALRAIREVKP